MQNTGMSRPVDDLGRIVIPKEIRTRFRIGEGTRLSIYVDEDENIMLKVMDGQERCSVCGSTEELRRSAGPYQRYVCGPCLDSFETSARRTYA